MSVKLTQSKGFALVEELYQDRTKRARELRKEGRKVFGYVCCFPPIEMLTALDIVPVRVMGDVKEPITQADAYLETIMCGFVRSCFDRVIKGKYDFLDGIVVPHSCDTICKVYDIWRYYKIYPFDHFILMPHMLQPASYDFFKTELGRFRAALEEYTGTKLTDEKLRKAIQMHNENRALLRKLYDLRKPDPPLVSGAEITKILVTCMNLPVLEASELLRQVIDEASHRKEGRPEKKTARVLVYGPEMDNEDFIRLVEECDANVVIDDVCIGTRYFWHDVEPTNDPLDGIVHRYLDKIPCPRTYRDPPPGASHEAEVENRFSYLKDYAKEWNVNGVIFYILRCCDTFELDVPDVRDYLKKLGYPVLHLEDDYSMTAIGQFRTRIQAFIEMIG